MDQSFVRSLPDDQDSLAIVRAIVSLSKHLGFALTAEGIGTIEQARILGRLSCEALQGFYFSRPVSDAEVSELAKRLLEPWHGRLKGVYVGGAPSK